MDTETGVLDISGEGDMTNWSSYSSAPWYSYKSYIKTIIIGDDVTSIGDSAFAECHRLTSAMIPDSVTSIGDYAFCYCDDLTIVTIGNSVTSIGDYAFYECIGLTNVTIGNSVTSIGECAFIDCCSLTSITIPDSVESIGANAFVDCYLTDIVIGKSVKSIGDYAFRGCFLLEDVFYAGSKEDWNKISIGKVNSILTKARIHYNSSSAHSYFERIVEPTCTQDGYKLCVCECDNVYIEEHIDALGHSYKNGVCINCGKTTGGISAPENSSVVID